MTPPTALPAALLFDLDGTLIDTDALHFAVFRDLFAERGRSIDQAFYLENVHGQMNEAIFTKHTPTEDAAALSEDKEARFRVMLGSSAPAMPGTADLLAQARALGWGLAVVTNAPRTNAEAMLRAIGLIDAFDTLVIADECTHGKPHPAPYLEAMARLGVSPERSVAFEDSPSGLRAAKASGAICVGIRSSLDDAALKAAGAHATLSDFTDPALHAVLAPLKGPRDDPHHR